MIKIVSSVFAGLLGISSLSIAADDAFVIPYFNTAMPYSTRFQIVNTTTNTIPVVITFKSIRGEVIGTATGTLGSYDMIASAMTANSNNTSKWFIAPDDNSSFPREDIISGFEGYIEVEAKTFTVPGPSNPGWSKNFSNQNLNVSYSYWNNNILVKESDSFRYPFDPLFSLWTTNQGRSTDFVVTKPGQYDTGCIDVRYLISDRDGQYVTSNETVAGPAGQQRVKTICNDVTVFNFGTPLFTSDSSQSFNSDITDINNRFNVNAVGGWVNLETSGFYNTIRSNN